MKTKEQGAIAPKDMAPINPFLNQETFTAWYEERKGIMINPEHVPEDGRTLNIIAPPGIGDIAWVMAKVLPILRERQAAGKPTIFHVLDGFPRRGHDYLALFGAECRWIAVSVQELYAMPQPSVIPEHGTICLSANVHLEDGKPLADWLPGYPLALPIPERYIQTRTPPKCAPAVVHMCHAGYMEGNLLYRTWARILLKTIERYGDIYLIGGNSNTDHAFAQKVIKTLSAQDRAKVTPVFDAPLENVLYLMQDARAVIGPASGITILSTYQYVPTLMAYPRWLCSAPSELTGAAKELHPNGTHMPGAWEPKGDKCQWLFMDELYESVCFDNVLDTMP